MTRCLAVGRCDCGCIGRNGYQLRFDVDTGSGGCRGCRGDTGGFDSGLTCDFHQRVGALTELIGAEVDGRRGSVATTVGSPGNLYPTVV